METVKLFIYEQQREKRFFVTEKILFEKLGLWLTTKLWLAQNLFWNENRKIMGKKTIIISDWLKLQNILFNSIVKLYYLFRIYVISVYEILRIEECLKYSRKIDIWNWRRICIWFWYWKYENKNWALFKNGQFRKQI